jgi:tRNA A37 threonylcarbamoyltransferase TsaD
MKLEYYNDLLKPKKVVIGGGVAANKLLANTVAENKNLNVVLTERQYTGDNAAMIGFYASLLLNK